MANCYVCGTKLGFGQGKTYVLDYKMCDACYEHCEKLSNWLNRCTAEDVDENSVINIATSMEHLKPHIENGTAQAHVQAMYQKALSKIEAYNNSAHIEMEKREFAKSFNEYYEYDVVTIINKDHGVIDKKKMLNILSEHARNGWKLHTIYSNELGKNAIALLGFSINSTACEDVLIFERRIAKNE